ncbi:MAG: glycine oxidase ThiO [Candidatus Dormibacteria bacterium]
MGDVAIIGGGAIGLAIAWRAALEGLSVTLADPAPGSGASRVAAGMLAPAGEAAFGEELLLRLNLESATRYPSFVAELEEATGASCGYRECGALVVATDGDELAALQRELRFRAEVGLDAEPLTARECRRLEPRLAPSLRGGVLLRGDHQVDPRALVSGLLIAIERSGVDVRRQRAAVDVRDGLVRGITLDDGSQVHADRVVIAAGSWSASIAGVPDAARPPVYPVKGQDLHLRERRDMQLASHVVRGNGVYVLPRGDGRYVIGATSEEQGFDTSVTAGAVYELLRDARALLPDVSELELVEAAAGLRPGTPDNAPLLGETVVAGLFAATGHYRNGILLTPVTADAMVALLTDEAMPDVAAPFTPARFAAYAAVVA